MITQRPALAHMQQARAVTRTSGPQRDPVLWQVEIKVGELHGVAVSFPPPFTGEVSAKLTEGGVCFIPPLAPFRGTPPVNGGRNRHCY
ncbi:hypothetical protein GCM10007417_13490 [Glycocaulis alkaliphilus]|nr:hypothetical protein GCM10007417_13490 [Glycocaulis alkaliphilus]